MHLLLRLLTAAFGTNRPSEQIRIHGSFRRDNGHVTGQEITALAETLVKRLRTRSSREQQICEVLLRKPK